MIAFSCSHCGMKIKVLDQFAGRSSKCPTCKEPLVVPMPSATLAFVPPRKIDGEESSLAKMGHEGGVTLAHDPAGRKPTAVPGQKPRRSVGEALAGRTKSNERYIIEGEIARGGMGAVLRAVDGDLRREVAVKYMLDEKDPKKKARFIEEAQINAQLEHPNIVPVYDLRIDAQKRPYLMMKMVKGRNLKSVLDQLRTNAKQAENDYSLGRLLNVLVNICNGLAFAHAHGVIHRDLKPANIMLGDFGEVYIMDWGLAKVLKGDGASRMESGPPVAMPGSTSVSAKRSSKVATNREDEADLTQEGSILGTPVYMPPEQANGNVQAIDQRSDVYTLGAILYEMLTLQPPIDKEGGYMAIMLRVASGEIIPPEQRQPKRARAGKIPLELAAIAMRALAKEPGQRYQNVEALRTDIELFREGRSVSAKQDTAREMIWKLVKRNKAMSLISTVAFVLLVYIWGRLSWENYEARKETDLAYTALKNQTQDVVPALIRSGRLAIHERDFDDAMKQAELALVYAPNNVDALLLKGQALIVHQDFARACTALEHYLKQRANDKDTRELLELSRLAKPDDIPMLLALARVFHRQQAYALVDGLLSKYGKNSQEARQQILQMYREIIEKGWPGKGRYLQIDPTGFHLTLRQFTQLNDLSPLQGIPLVSLDVSSQFTQVRDLSPLKGMPLTTLNLQGSRQLEDLTPLKGMPLTTLNLQECKVTDLTPLEGMPLTSLSLMQCPIADLTPLKGMPLTSLNLANCPVADLTPLQGMRLTSLDIHNCSGVTDLSALKDLPLTSLDLLGCTQLKDLTPLQGMNLATVTFTPKNVTQAMDTLRQMKSLKTIRIAYGATGSLRPEEFWKRYDAGEFNK